MKTHLSRIHVAAAAIAVASVYVQPAVAQYAPYRPNQQPFVAPTAAPQPAAPAVNPYPPSTAYQQQQYQAPATTYHQAPTTAYPPQAPQAQYLAPAPATVYQQAPTGPYPYQASAPYAQQPYAQPATGYPQPAAPQPAKYDPFSFLAKKPKRPAESKKAQKQDASAAVQPNDSAATMPPPNKNSTSAAVENGSAAQGACGCNGSAAYGAGDYYGAGACGCNGSYPDAGISNYFDDGCHENQWFGGVYFLEMSRTNASPVKLTVEVDHSVAPDPYYPPASATIMTSRNVNFDFREGVEVRLGSTFTVGEPCSSCDCNNRYGYNGCGGGNGCGCGSTMYAWEVAWWGINSEADDVMVLSPNLATEGRIYGMKSFVGLQYDRDGAGGAYAYRPVNEYYGYNLPIPDPGVPGNGDLVVLGQRVRTDFRAQDLELNFIRFPVCETGCGSCNSGCDGGCGPGYGACGCNGDTGAAACGCDDGCGGGLGFSMYGSCGVRYFHVHDYFMYANEFGEWGGGAYDQTAYDGFTYDSSNELMYDVQVRNNLVGPQVGWTSDYCWGRWNLFCNSTFGIFDNHMSSFQRMWSGGGGVVRFAGDGTPFVVNSHKDAVAFMGELRVGTAYDVTCHWRAVAAYRAVAITGLATATAQLASDFTNRESVAIIDSDNSVIIHGVQVGAECRY